jgi:hypothetical protein
LDCGQVLIAGGARSLEKALSDRDRRFDVT